MNESSPYREDRTATPHHAAFRHIPRIRGMANRKAALAAAIAIPAATAATLWLAVPASASPAARTVVSGFSSTQLMTTSATSNTLSAIDTGVFTGAGVDHEGNTVDTLVFPVGTYKVWHSSGTGTQTLDPRTCVLRVNVHGTYKAYGGTGKFRGISGTGTYHASVLSIEARSAGTCSATLVPVAYQEIITASGTSRL
jgi:hypothetical protein